MSEDILEQAIDILKRAEKEKPGEDYRAAFTVLEFSKGKSDAVKRLHAAANQLVAAGLAGNRGNAVWLMANDPKYKAKYAAIVDAARRENPAAAEGVKGV